MEAVSTIFKQIRTLVLPLSAEQRLELIQDIASLAPLEGRFTRDVAAERTAWHRTSILVRTACGKKRAV